MRARASEEESGDKGRGARAGGGNSECLREMAEGTVSATFGGGNSESGLVRTMSFQGSVGGLVQCLD